MQIQGVVHASMDRGDHPRFAVRDPRHVTYEGLIEDRVDGRTAVVRPFGMAMDPCPLAGRAGSRGLCSGDRHLRRCYL